MKSKLPLIKVFLLVFFVAMVGCTSPETGAPSDTVVLPSLTSDTSGTQGDLNEGVVDAPTQSEPTEPSFGLAAEIDKALLNKAVLTVVQPSDPIDLLHKQYVTYIDPSNAEERLEIITKAWRKYFGNAWTDGEATIDLNNFLMFVAEADPKMDKDDPSSALNKVRLANQKANVLLDRLEVEKDQDLLQEIRDETFQINFYTGKMKNRIFNAAKIYGVKLEKPNEAARILSNKRIEVGQKILKKIKKIFEDENGGFGLSFNDQGLVNSIQSNQMKSITNVTFVYEDKKGNSTFVSFMTFRDLLYTIDTWYPLTPGYYGTIPFEILTF